MWTPCITSFHQFFKKRAVPLDVAAGPPRRLADGVQELSYYWSLMCCRAAPAPALGERAAQHHGCRAVRAVTASTSLVSFADANRFPRSASLAQANSIISRITRFDAPLTQLCRALVLILGLRPLLVCYRTLAAKICAAQHASKRRVVGTARLSELALRAIQGSAARETPRRPSHGCDPGSAGEHA